MTAYILETSYRIQGCVSSDNCHYNYIYSYLALSLLIFSSSDQLLIRYFSYIWYSFYICKIVYIVVFWKCYPFTFRKFQWFFRCLDPLCKRAIRLKRPHACRSITCRKFSTLLSVISHSLIFHVYVIVKTVFNLQSNFWCP